LGEATLDIEALIGLAPQASLLIYQAPSSDSSSPGAGPYDNFAAIVSQDRAQIVSVSWGQCEALDGAADAGAEATLFEKAAAQGQTIVSASGDSGSEDCFSGTPAGDTQLAGDDPAGQPFVTGVGGTHLGTIGPRPSETVWNGSGSDPTQPAGWQGIGGTSLAAPIWAAVLALADASRACAPRAPARTLRSGSPIRRSTRPLRRATRLTSTTWWRATTPSRAPTAPDTEPRLGTTRRLVLGPRTRPRSRRRCVAPRRGSRTRARRARRSASR
jgi:subtilase family serine protease